MDSFFSSENKSVHFENQLILQERNTEHLLYKHMWVCARYPLFHSTGNVMIYRICLRVLVENKIYILFYCVDNQIKDKNVLVATVLV